MGPSLTSFIHVPYCQPRSPSEKDGGMDLSCLWDLTHCLIYRRQTRISWAPNTHNPGRGSNTRGILYSEMQYRHHLTGHSDAIGTKGSSLALDFLRILQIWTKIPALENNVPALLTSERDLWESSGPADGEQVSDVSLIPSMDCKMMMIALSRP